MARRLQAEVLFLDARGAVARSVVVRGHTRRQLLREVEHAEEVGMEEGYRVVPLLPVEVDDPTTGPAPCAPLFLSAFTLR